MSYNYRAYRGFGEHFKPLKVIKIWYMKNFQITDKETGKKYWISRSIGVHGILLVNGPEDQKYLLIEKRGPGCPDEIGKWANPTGYLDWDETLIEALYREVWEEIGLDLGKLEHCKVEFSGYFDDPAKENQNVTIRFKVDLEYSEIKPLLRDKIINPNTESRGGESDEVSAIDLFKIYPRKDLVNPKLFAFNHGELVNNLIRKYNNL